MNEPNFGHRKKGRTFFGWIIGIKFKPTWPGSLRTEDPIIVACQTSLARIIRANPTEPDILGPLDHLLLALSQRSQQEAMIGSEYFKTSHDRVSDLASRMGGSVRTLHRRMRTSTGFPPKRFLAMQRFRRSVYEIATRSAGLSLIAFNLGFSRSGSPDAGSFSGTPAFRPVHSSRHGAGITRELSDFFKTPLRPLA